jgi:hypothetical protein
MSNMSRAVGAYLSQKRLKKTKNGTNLINFVVEKDENHKGTKDMEKQVHPKDVESDVVRVGPQPNFFKEKKSVLKVFYSIKKLKNV